MLSMTVVLMDREVLLKATAQMSESRSFEILKINESAVQ